MKNRRRAKRLAVRIPIMWAPEGDGKKNLTDAFLFDTGNITMGGVFLKTGYRPKRGARLNLKLVLNPDEEPLSLTGRVVWLATKNRHPYLYPGFGVKFEKVPGKDHKRLKEFMGYKLENFKDANELKKMYINLKDMASRLVELEERHATAPHFRKIIDNAISEIDAVAHLLDREIDEIKRM